MKLPWMKFFPNDWKADDRLRICSLGARGLWLELISMAHEAEPYGHVLVNGIAPTDSQIARIVGEETETITQLLSELKAAGVFSLSENGVMYCRRMVREAAKSEKNSKNGKKGGRPRSLKDNDNSEVAFKNESEIKANEKPNIKRNESENLSETKALEARSQKLDIYSVPNGTDADASRVVDVGKQVWDVGLKLLAGYEIPEKRARPILGKWVKAAGSEGKLLEVLNEAGSEERAEIISFVEAALKPKDSQILVDWLYGLQGGPMKRTTAEFQVESWVKSLGLDAVTQAITKAKSVGWKRDKTIEHLDSLAADKNRDSYEKPKQAEVAQVEDPHWVAVRDAMYAEDPENENKTRSFLPMINSVNVNGTRVKMRAVNRFAVGHIEKNFGPRLLELFKLEKPGIEIVEVGL